MSAQLVGDLCARLADAGDTRRMGSVLVDGLRRHWGAESAVAWLPESPAESVSADDVALSHDLLMSSSTRDLLGAIRDQRLDKWFASRGLGSTCAVELPSERPGRIAAAWRDPGDLPSQMPDILQLLAAHVSELVERRRLEARLEQAVAVQIEAEEQIEQTRRVRAVGEMASGIVHDFNNALTSILGYAELALGPLEKGDAYFDDLTSIRTAALDAAALVRRLRSLGQKGRPTDEREVADLRDIARLMPSLARPRWNKASQVNGVTFDIVVDEGPAPLVYVAIAEIRELLLNLLFNAVDAMPGGGRITIATRTDEHGWAVISVADQGVGMSEDTKRQLFRPFFSTKGDRGSGLGLSVCHTIAARHAARLEVESTPGTGTTFELAVPPAPASHVAAARPVAASTPARTLACQRVLLVDDQPEIRDSVGEMLRAIGHDVKAVESGESAVAYAALHRIDVLITDLGMPEMNGIEVAQRFRVLAPGVPVILLTGWGLEPDAVPPGNVASVLGKPVTLKHLHDALTACTADPTAARRTKCS